MAVGDKRLAESDVIPEIRISVAVGIGDQDREQNNPGRISRSELLNRDTGEPPLTAPASAKAGAAGAPESATIFGGTARPSPLVFITRRAARAAIVSAS
jgi:hypothetical protein